MERDMKMNKFRRDFWKPTKEDYADCCGKWIRPLDNSLWRVVPCETDVENPRCDIPLGRFHNKKDFDYVVFSVNDMRRIEGIPEQCIPVGDIFESPKSEPTRESYDIRYPLLAEAFKDV
jgi:hypothetical protein